MTRPTIPTSLTATAAAGTALALCSLVTPIPLAFWAIWGGLGVVAVAQTVQANRGRS